jgi:hypothetical protein
LSARIVQPGRKLVSVSVQFSAAIVPHSRLKVMLRQPTPPSCARIPAEYTYDMFHNAKDTVHNS